MRRWLGAFGVGRVAAALVLAVGARACGCGQDHAGATSPAGHAGATSSAGVPRRSDVLLTSRSEHYVPPVGEGAGSGLYTTWTAATAFNATRLDWVYSLNASFVEEAAGKRGLASVSLAMNANIPDSQTGPAAYTIGRVLNVHGEPLTAPWMQAWTPLPYYGCVNNGSAYQEVAFARARALIDAGADVIQHDDPTVNSEAASWNNGDPEQSGCYCSVCMAGFTTALLDGSLDANTTALGVNGSFNYKNYLLDEMSAAPTRETEDARLLEPTSNASQELRELFLLYQQNVTNSYARKLRDHVNNYSAHVRNRSVFPMSCNNGGRWPQPPESSPYPIFDYAMGELAFIDGNPGGLRQIFVDSVPENHSQVVTMPKKSPPINSSDDTLRIRRSVAQSYALGGSMLVPWDIYLPAPTAPRFFGSEAEFGDLFNFVTSFAALLDAADTMPGYRSSTDRLQVSHTGHNGDGARWRLPTDTPASAGKQVNTEGWGGGVAVGACAWECLADEQCVAIFSIDWANDGCQLLYEPLQVVNGTLLVGTSYTFDRSWPEARARRTRGREGATEAGAGGAAKEEPLAAWTNVTLIDAILRVSSGNAGRTRTGWCDGNGGTPAAVVLHLVDWRNTYGTRDASNVDVFVNSTYVCGAALASRDATISVEAMLSTPAAPDQVGVTTEQAGGLTHMVLPAAAFDASWAMVELTCSDAG